MDQFDIGRGADEGKRHHVDAEVQREREILDVLLRQGRRGHVHSGQRDALVVADRAAFDDGADHVVALDGVDHQCDFAVVDQHPVTGHRVLG